MGKDPYSIFLCCLRFVPVVVVCIAAAGQTTSVTFNRQAGYELTWNMPRPVLPYRSYMDVYPTRYDIPVGLSRITWSFQSLLSSWKSCGNISVHFLVQHGGLPLVNQTSLSFPDNYFIPSSSLIHFELVLGQMISFALFNPPPGPWYVIAYTNEDKDAKIRQKGLYKESNRCTINYVSNIQLGPQLKRHQLSLSEFHTLKVSKDGTLISFTLPISTFGFQVLISSCHSSNCSLTLKYEPFNMNKELTQDCSDVDFSPCIFRVPSPMLGDEQRVVLTSPFHKAVNVLLQITALSCQKLFTSSRIPCVVQHPLARINTITPGFSSLGYIYLSPASLHIAFGLTRTIIIPFHIEEPNDIGHTLQWKMHISSFRNRLVKLTDSIEIHVCAGLVYNYLPDLHNDTFDVCQNLTKAVHVSMIGGAQWNESRIYVPYPKVGIWHVVVQATCLMVKNGSEVDCPLQTSVDMSLNIQPCINNGCGGRGDCLFRTVGSELVTYTACKCFADYRGYGCQDDTHSLSSTVQLAGVFLLTMSNLLFMPAIGLALSRRFFVEAFVYSYTMFFSTFYHACDGDRIDQYRVCIIPFNVLQSGDFFGSSCSLWITLIAMAAIRIRYLTPLLQVMGPLGFFIGVVYDKTSLYVIAVPIVTGILALIISWGTKMYRRKTLYPSKRRYLYFLLPGIAIATAAAVIYSFLETENNYKYLHSLWHACIALSVCFLLPPKNGRVEANNKSEITMTTPLTHISAEPDHSLSNHCNHNNVNHVDSNHSLSNHINTNHVDSDHSLSNHIIANHVDSNHSLSNHINANHIDSDHSLSNHINVNYVDSERSNNRAHTNDAIEPSQH